MKLMPAVTLALAIAAVGAPAWAVQQDPHAGHHPAAVALAPAPAPAPAASTAAAEQPGTDMTRMDAQMQAMKAMHEKMMAAKTPAQRKALMAEHMKTMQDGMNMMNDMPSGGMGMMGEMPKGGMGDMKCDMASHKMMEKRMQMMQSMMQMMMDRLHETPTR